MQDAWNPAQYDRFKAERQQPFLDLLSLIQASPGMRVVDLGCGTGELTGKLHRHLEAMETIGIDRSPEMLAKAEALSAPGLRFEAGDIGEFRAESRYDVVFSNAALHWVSDHAELFARLTAALTGNGQLAVQVPAMHGHSSQLVAAELAREEPFRGELAGYVRYPPVLEPDEYARLLHDLGYRVQHVRLQVYGHLLASREQVVEWVKGTLLTDYQSRMSSRAFAEFLGIYRERLLRRLEDCRPYFFPFRRILLWARLG